MSIDLDLATAVASRRTPGPALVRWLHPLAGALALALIASFWTATVIAETLGSPSAVATVKTAIAWGLLALVPALAATGASGLRLARGRRGPLLAAKRTRTKLAAANGILVLVPAALWLAAKARAGELDAAFYTVQAVELVAGAVNLTLLARNMRDGFRLAGRRRARRAGS
jgi:hypothetical protein